MKVEIENQQGNLKKHHKDYIYIYVLPYANQHCHDEIFLLLYSD